MTVPHQSYYELKKETSDEFARKTLLYNLECLNGNIRACARKVRCSHHTVYLALKKQAQGNLTDDSHRPKGRHPKKIEDEKDLLKRCPWWEYIYNLERCHQGIDNLTPYEKLKSLGYVTGEEICLFPPLILDKICCLDLFQIKKKSVQDHIDYYPPSSVGPHV